MHCYVSVTAMRTTINFSTHETFSVKLLKAGPSILPPEKGAPIAKRSTNRDENALLIPSEPPVLGDAGAPAALGTGIGWAFRNAPIAPRKPSWRRNMAAISPLDQYRIAYEIVSIV